MSELVALHTQQLAEPAASRYLRALEAAVTAARLNKSFPDRRGLIGTLRALGAECHGGLYDSIFVDARSGLPNMASLTRVLADREVGRMSLPRLASQAELEARRDEAEVFARLARKRPYYEALARGALAPVDEHRVLLRKHEPTKSRASFRVELTKLDGNGNILRVVIELTQTSGLWGHQLVRLDSQGEVAEGTEALRAMVYRLASFDSETLFFRLHDLEGVMVERVQRGIVGPVLWAVETGGRTDRVLSPHADALTRAFGAHVEGGGVAPGGVEIIAGFGTDVAGAEVPDERSNDPLVPLLGTTIEAHERPRYARLRERFGFRVYKDRKFVATPGVLGLVEGACDAAGTKNLVYPLVRGRQSAL